MSNAKVSTQNRPMSAFDNIKAGLEHAIEFQRNALAGKPNTAKIHHMPELDVKPGREQTGFTQAKFAQTRTMPRSVISIRPDTLGGTPYFVGTRVPIKVLFD
jgi:DNA-binding transcriptional regulator YiaG